MIAKSIWWMLDKSLTHLQLHRCIIEWLSYVTLYYRSCNWCWDLTVCTFTEWDFFLIRKKKSHTFWNIKICKEHVCQDVREGIVVGKTTWQRGWLLSAKVHTRGSVQDLKEVQTSSVFCVWALLFVMAGSRNWVVKRSRMVAGSLVPCAVSKWVAAFLWLAYCISISNVSLY